MVELEQVRRRLELVLAALYGRPIVVEAAERPPARGALSRFFDPTPPHLRVRDALPTSEGERIRLPAALDARDGPEAGVARYRLLALEQAERVTRGTAALVPEDDPLARDLFLLRESAIADASIARAVRGTAGVLAAERAAALARRPAREGLTALEREVESLVRGTLGADPGALPAALAVESAPGSTPAESLAWAREMAARLRARAGGAKPFYRGTAAVPFWGAPPVRGAASSSGAEALPATDEAPAKPLPLIGSPVGGQQMVESEAPSEMTAPDPRAPRPTSSQEASSEPADPEDTSGVLEHDPSAPHPAPLHPDDEASRVVPDRDTAPLGAMVEYPEWDQGAGRYLPRAAAVREREPMEGDAAWSADVLAHHAALVRRVRQQFERLRARRLRLRRQRDGEELDLAAVVQAQAELRAGRAADDRLYAAVRPARRGLAITLLVDVSGSTDTPVTGTQQVIDVEKVALLLASEALDALGDAYSVLAFSSRGARDVRVTPIKSFAERNGERVRRRVAAMAPDGNTRLGAALRHATAGLARQPAGHRLLLLISDGKPNDQDRYQGAYAVEDARQAVLEARALGVHPFCLTVDREEPEYLSHIFGVAGHTILRHPEQLPMAVLGVVRQMLQG